MNPWSSLPPNMSTTARGLSSSMHVADVREPVEDVGPLEPARDPSVDAVDGADRRVPGDRAEERLARDDDERVAGDPDAELALRRELHALGGRLRDDDGRRGLRLRRRDGVSISSSSERPSAALSARRGRSRKSASLTFSSGPVTPSATSRFHPSGWIVADLCKPGAFRRSAIPSPTSETTIADPAECRRRPSLRRAAAGAVAASRRLGRLHQNWK